jgi:hypothetical protein
MHTSFTAQGYALLHFYTLIEFRIFVVVNPFLEELLFEKFTVTEIRVTI